MRHSHVFGVRPVCELCGLSDYQIQSGVRMVLAPWLKPFMSVFVRGWLAIALGKTIIAARYLTERELEHEMVHVTQWMEYGWTFPFRYVWASIRAARAGGDWYRDNEYEIEARS